VAVAWLLFAVAPAACTCNGSETPAPDEAREASAPPPADMRKACEQRRDWSQRLRRKCTKCIALATAPRCGCKTDERAYSGLCASFQGKRLSEDACKPVWQCAYKCKPTECDCVAACYEGKERCHGLALALDACLVKICDPFCR